MYELKPQYFSRYFLSRLISQQTQMWHIKKECSNTNWDRAVRIYGDRALPFPQGCGALLLQKLPQSDATLLQDLLPDCVNYLE